MGTDLYEAEDGTFYARMIGGPCDKCHVPGGLLYLHARDSTGHRYVKLCYLCAKGLLAQVEDVLERRVKQPKEKDHAKRQGPADPHSNEPKD